MCEDSFFFFFPNKFSCRFQMASKDNTSSSGTPQNMEFTLKAMQQQFERFNMVLGEIRDRMDRQEDMIVNLQREQSNRDHNLRRHGRRNQREGNDYESENEVRGETEDEYAETEVGRNRHRRDRHWRDDRRVPPRDRNRRDGNLGNIKMKIPFF